MGDIEHQRHIPACETLSCELSYLPYIGCRDLRKRLVDGVAVYLFPSSHKFKSFVTYVTDKAILITRGLVTYVTASASLLAAISVTYVTVNLWDCNIGNRATATGFATVLKKNYGSGFLFSNISRLISYFSMPLPQLRPSAIITLHISHIDYGVHARNIFLYRVLLAGGGSGGSAVADKKGESNG